MSFSRPAQVTFNLPDENARIRFRHPSPRETLCITKHHNLPGLIAVVEMPQRSGDLLGHAFQAQAICDGVVSSAFALTLADMRESFPVLACDATSGVTDRTFVHFFADRLVMGRRAHLDPEQWSARASGVFNQSSNSRSPSDPVAPQDAHRGRHTGPIPRRVDGVGDAQPGTLQTFRHFPDRPGRARVRQVR